MNRLLTETGDNGRGDGRAPGGSRILFRQHRDVLDVRAWVDLTKDPVTEDLEARLPWIREFPKAQTAWRIIRRDKHGSGAGPIQTFIRTGDEGCLSMTTSSALFLQWIHITATKED